MGSQYDSAMVKDLLELDGGLGAFALRQICYPTKIRWIHVGGKRKLCTEFVRRSRLERLHGLRCPVWLIEYYLRTQRWQIIKLRYGVLAEIDFLGRRQNFSPF
jgi:hypothetical protein